MGGWERSRGLADALTWDRKGQGRPGVVGGHLPPVRGQGVEEEPGPDSEDPASGPT